jgi:hypothetical protein
MSPRMKKIVIGGLVAGIVAFGAAQLVAVKGIGSNPPERFKIDAPPEVDAILRRACFDCHSNETRWPLYSRIAPGSWLMARDVTKRRQHLNLSKWDEADEEERVLDMENMWEQVEAGEMPKWFYVYPMHLAARLSDADKATLKAWVDAAKAKAKAKDDGDEKQKDTGKDK